MTTLTDEQCDVIHQSVCKRERGRGVDFMFALIRAGAAFAECRTSVPREPVAWRWRAKGGTVWRFDDGPEWRGTKADDGLEWYPLYAGAAQPAARTYADTAGTYAEVAQPAAQGISTHCDACHNRLSECDCPNPLLAQPAAQDVPVRSRTSDEACPHMWTDREESAGQECLWCGDTKGYDAAQPAAQGDKP